MAFFSVVIHHNGRFIGPGQPGEYEEGHIDAIHGLDPDRWSLHEAVRLVDRLGHERGTYRFWWKPKGNVEDAEAGNTITLTAVWKTVEAVTQDDNNGGSCAGCGINGLAAAGFLLFTGTGWFARSN